MPLDERELPLIFRDRTIDYQEIAVQASITYRFVDPETRVTRIDFTIENTQGLWTSTPLEQVGGLLTELAQQHAVGVLASMKLTEVMVSGELRQVADKATFERRALAVEQERGISENELQTISS